MDIRWEGGSKRERTLTARTICSAWSQEGSTSA